MMGHLVTNAQSAFHHLERYINVRGKNLKILHLCTRIYYSIEYGKWVKAKCDKMPRSPPLLLLNSHICWTSKITIKRIWMLKIDTNRWISHLNVESRHNLFYVCLITQVWKHEWMNNSRQVVVKCFSPFFSGSWVQYRSMPLEETLAAWSKPSISSADTRSGPWTWGMRKVLISHYMTVLSGIKNLSLPDTGVCFGMYFVLLPQAAFLTQWCLR